MELAKPAIDTYSPTLVHPLSPLGEKPGSTHNGMTALTTNRVLRKNQNGDLLTLHFCRWSFTSRDTALSLSAAWENHAAHSSLLTRRRQCKGRPAPSGGITFTVFSATVISVKVCKHALIDLSL